MIATRLGLSLCLSFHTLTLLLVTSRIHELAHEILLGKPLPAVAAISGVFDPIGPLLFIIPILVGFASWRHLEPKELSFRLILTHVLLVGFSLAAFTSVLIATATQTYVNGIRPLTGTRIMGNIFFGITLVAMIVHSYVRPNRTEQARAAKPSP